MSRKDEWMNDEFLAATAAQEMQASLHPLVNEGFVIYVLSLLIKLIKILGLSFI